MERRVMRYVPLYKLALTLFCTLISLSVFANEPTNPWNQFESVPFEKVKYKESELPTVQLQRDEHGFEYEYVKPQMDVDVYYPLLEERGLWSAPVLIFFKGSLPMVGIHGYKDLLENIAKTGVLVIVPVYKPDRRYTWHRDIKAMQKLQEEKEFDSTEIAYDSILAIQSVLPAIRSRFQFVLAEDWSVYGHSSGARIAISFIQQSQQLSPKLRYGIPKPAAVMLEGVSPQEIDLGKDGVISDQFDICETLKDFNWDFPTTFLHYETDEIFLETTLATYDCLPKGPKQILRVHSYEDDLPANHFSTFSNDKSTWLVAWCAKKKWTEIAEDYHGYPIRLVSNVVDIYGPQTVIPALAWAHNFGWPEKGVLGRTILYDTLRNYEMDDGKTLRSLVEQSPEGEMLKHVFPKHYSFWNR